MNFVRLTVLLLYFYLCNLTYALFSVKEVEIFNLFVRPYGITLKIDGSSDLMKVFGNLGKCSAFNETYRDCNSIFATLATSTTKSERSKLESLLSKRCSGGSYSCLHNGQKSDGWLIKVQRTMTSLCKKKCFETLEKLVERCIQPGQSEIKESDRTYIQFVIEVLKLLCNQEDSSSCGQKFITGLLHENTSSSEECDVEKNLQGHSCSTECKKDLQQFYNKLGCCVGSVSDIMDCYSIKPQNDSYGIFVHDSNLRCKVERPAACSQNTKKQLSPCSQVNATPAATTSLSSSKGYLIAGICIAVLICIIGVVLVGNYLYRRMTKRAKVRFEDYGYSRLKMLEDDLYFDVEVEEDDSKGFVDL